MLFTSVHPCVLQSWAGAQVVVQAVRLSDAAAFLAAEVAMRREEETREGTTFQKKWEKELAERLKVVQQQKLTGTTNFSC